MKKVLFASTALIATAGMAAAEVSFGGFGRFGLLYVEDAAGVGARETRIEQRFRLTITGSTETDAGVKFEGRIRFQTDDQADGTSNIARRSAAGFAVTAGGFRLDVGSVSDVLDSGDVVDYFGYGIGLTATIEQSTGFGLPASGFGVANDDSLIVPTVKLRYTAGDLTVAASYTDDLDGAGREEWQIGAGYNFGNYSAGLVYGEETPAGGVSVDFWAASFSGSLGAFDFTLLVADRDDGLDTRVGLSAKYDIGAATEIRFVIADNGQVMDSEVYGLGFRHSLGGGVSLRGGIGEVGGATVADLGVNFDF